MNNKKLGTEFEKEMVQLLSDKGFWVHFISPDNRGAQPFDIIAVKNCIAVAIDCKTCEDKFFRIDRLEDNQLLAFGKWLECGNTLPYIAVKHKNEIHMIDYKTLLECEKINLEEKREFVLL